MEAGSLRRPGAAPGVRSLVEALRMLRFGGESILALRGSGRYLSEVLRQTGRLILSTTLLMVFLQAVLGAVLALFGGYLLRSIGAADYVGAVTSVGTGRGTVIVMTAYVLSAKVGCGLVAEIGSMRIGEELAALDSVGVDPMRFVVATRLAAMWLYLPFMYCIAQASAELGAFAAVVSNLGTSAGTWEAVHFAMRNPVDYLYGFIDCFTIGTIVVLVAMYYGWTVRGGPAEVGHATARSMIVNLVAGHAVYALANLTFYGTDPKLPIGG